MPISKIKTSSILADAASTNLNIDAGTLFLDATNNRVGIGTTSPGQNLHVASSSTGQTLVNIENTSAGGYSWNVGTIGSVAGLGPVGTFIIRDSTNGANRIAIGTSGNVGIGTTTIGTKLVVADTGQSLSGTAYNVADFTNSGQTLGTRIGYDSSNGAVIASAGVDKPIAFWQYNTANYLERMRIDSSGNVGIGTTTPTDFGSVYKLLEVKGSQSGVIQASSASGLLTVELLAGLTAGYVGTRTSHPLVLRTGDTERMRIDTSGNVGIGTSSINSRITATATNNYSDIYGIIQAYNTGTGATDNASITVKNYSGTSQFMQWENNGLRIGSRILTNTGTGNVVFTYGNDTEGMRLNSSGNVGIGMTPVASYGLLQVGSAVTSALGVSGLQTFISATNSALGQNGNMSIVTTNAQAVDLGGSIGLGGKFVAAGTSVLFAQISGRKENSTDNNSAGYLQFATQPNGGTPTERMRIDSSGKVAISTTTPNASANITIKASATGDYQIQLEQSNATDGYALRCSASDGDLTFNRYASSAFTERMRLSTGGNLTITGATATKSTGTTWANPSDQRLKNDIRDYTKGTIELMQVRVCEWVYNGKGGTTEGMKGLGVIADEVMTVLPDTVENYDAKLNTDDEETTAIKKFDATEITWLLVKSFQEQQALITALTARITALEAK